MVAAAPFPLPFAASPFRASASVNESSVASTPTFVPVEVYDAGPDESSAAVTAPAVGAWPAMETARIAETVVATRAGTLFNVHPFDRRLPPHTIDARRGPEVRSPCAHSAGYRKEHGIDTR